MLLFFFNDTATTEIYTLSLHDALPISGPPTISATPRTATAIAIQVRRATGSPSGVPNPAARIGAIACTNSTFATEVDRKSTRLNSSHRQISYAVFCFEKKNRTSRLNP